MTEIVISREVDAPTISEDPATWLPAPARPAGRHRWATTLRAGPVRRTVTMEIGPVLHDGDRSIREITWEPGAAPGDILPMEVLLPAFKGDLIATDHQLTLEGTYTPPIGLIGRIADMVMRGTARATLQAFLDDVSRQFAASRTGG